MNDDSQPTPTTLSGYIYTCIFCCLLQIIKKNKYLKPSIKFTIGNIATCSAVAGNQLSETVETALSKLFLAVKAG